MGHQLRCLQYLAGSSSTASPHSRRMSKAHQPTKGIFVAHAGDRVPSPVHKSSESPQFQLHGTYNDDLPGGYFPPRRVNPDRSGLFVIAW